jgi:hypothetical protein
MPRDDDGVDHESDWHRLARDVTARAFDNTEKRTMILVEKDG